MLVYLDTSHLARIQRLVVDGPPAELRAFFEQWDNAGATLALSFHHLEEMATLPDNASLRRRLSGIYEFRRLAYSGLASATILCREILWQLIASAIAPNLAASIGQLIRGELYPEARPANVEAHLFGALEGLRGSRALRETSAELANLWQDAGAKLPWPSAKAHVTPEAAKAFDDAIGQLKMLGVLKPLSDHARAAFNEAGARRLENRQAVVQLHQLEDVAAAKGAPMGDLGELGIFFQLARGLAGVLERRDGGEFFKAVKTLNPYECPGWSLRLARLRAQQRHPIRAEPGDSVDADHLICAAYADLAFVDKRTMAFVEGESRRAHGRLAVQAVEHLHKASSLAEVLRVVEERVSATAER